jgi:hypothetical protein
MRGSPWALILENGRTAGFIGSTWKKDHVAAARARMSMSVSQRERQGLFGAESGPTHRGRM